MGAQVFSFCDLYNCQKKVGNCYMYDKTKLQTALQSIYIKKWMNQKKQNTAT